MKIAKSMNDSESSAFDPFEEDVLYQELRKLAAHRLRHELPGQTLDATGLVHEVYLRLYTSQELDRWVNEAHFFASAAEAMRRILVDNARRKMAGKRGGDLHRVDLPTDVPMSDPEAELIALDEAIERLETHDLRKANVVKLRYFAGLTTTQIAEALHVATSTVDADWAYAKAWLKMQISASPQ